MSTPEAKKNQRICQQAFKQLEALNEKILKNPQTTLEAKNTYVKQFIYETYRLGKQYGGFERRVEPDPKTLEYLMEAGLKFKKGPIRLRNESSYLTEEQVNQLKELAHYPDYINLCKKHPSLLKEAFNWSILNRLSVRVLVEFPQIAEKFDQSYLKGRCEDDPSTLKFHENNGVRDVTLNFEGKDQSILDPQKIVTLAKDWQRTVEECFKDYEVKNFVEGRMSFFKGLGAVNWDSFHHGPYNPKTGKVEQIDFSRPDWYKQLPAMKEYLTKEQATEKFGFPCDGKNWVFTVCTARQDERLDLRSGHTFIRMGIPQEDGTYAYTYGFGKFTTTYPQNGVDAAGYLFAPKKAVIQYPDNNEFYTHRELKEIHYSISPEKGQACLDSIKNDIEQADKGNFVFQYLVKNCTDWTVDKVRDFVGEKESHLFDLPYLQLQPSGFLGCVIKILRKTKDVFRKIVFSILAFIFCGWKKKTVVHMNGEKEVVNVFKTPPWDKRRMFHHPGVPFKQTT